MKNLWLVICQVLFSLITLVSGAVFVGLVFGNGLITAIFSIIFLLDLILPFLWFMRFVEERIGVDQYFTFGQVLWHILLVSVLYKYDFFPSDAVDFFVLAVSVFALLGFRYVTQDSFLKQER